MNDMTEGSPARLIIRFAIPMLIGNIFQQIYNVVDTLIVGRYLGEDALAGVGSTGTLTGFLLAFVIGLCNGAGLVVAQCFGCHDTAKMRKVVISLVWVAGSLTVITAFIGIIGAGFFLRLLSVPETVIGYSITYLKILYGFVLGNIAYNGAASILRSIGDSKTPLYALIAASLVNVVLDLFFIIVCQLGVAGVAYATVVSQHFSALICIAALRKCRYVLGLEKKGENVHRFGKIFECDKKTVVLLVKTGFPSAFQSCMICLGGMSVQRLINSYGASVMAAYVAANRIDSIAIQVIVSIGTALSVFTGQNMGQGNFNRIREGLRSTFVMMMAASISIAILVLVFRYDLMGFFLDNETSSEAVEIGASYLSIIGIAYIIAGIMQSYQNVIRGAGDVNTCMVAGLTELSGRIIFAYLLAPILGVTGIWIATPISWGCGCIIPVIRYYSGKWKTKGLV